jgi:hypothetical protein
MLRGCLSSELLSRLSVYGVERHFRLVLPIERAWSIALTARVPALPCAVIVTVVAILRLIVTNRSLVGRVRR